jgi:steroid 5-alpha reductase family enzyme
MKTLAFLCVALCVSVTAFVSPIGTCRGSIIPLRPKRQSRSSHVQPLLHALPVLPVSPPLHLWTSLVPPLLLGLYKKEWTVSLGYGTAVAMTAATLAAPYRHVPTGSLLAACHAASLVVYGLRLNVFLMLRNLWSTRIQDTNRRIEERALTQEGRGWRNRFSTRLPFILSCGLLYYGLAIPVWCTGKFVVGGSLTTTPPPLVEWKQTLLTTLVAIQWLGFGVAALGDLTKSYVKAKEQDERFLVTSGIFKWWRHPNYTGEIIGWTANALVGLLAIAFYLLQGRGDHPVVVVSVPELVANIGMLMLGWVGIVFVLLRATTNLETRQATEYGDTDKYRSWKASTWGGWQLPLPRTPASVPPVIPHLELDDEDSVQESGSGI